MKVPLLDLKAQYAGFRDEALQKIKEVCETQIFCLGPAVEQFEREIAAYCGCKHAIGVSSGTDALLLALMALDIKPGDEVITTPFTFFATAGVVSRLGARPVFADIDGESFNIDPAGIEAKITNKTRAIIPVHLFGQVAQMQPIAQIAARHNIPVIEDAAQSMGAAQNGVRCGIFGEIACFSFYPTKNLGAFGDAGLVGTNSPKAAEKIRLLRVHGENPRYYYRMIGGNFRMDNIQAAVLSVKLKYLDGWSERRRQNAVLYDSLLADLPVKAPKIEPNNVSIYNQYTIRAPRRDALQKFLAENEIGCSVFYPMPLHLQDCFRNLGYKRGDFPVAEQVCNEVLSLPVYPELTADQIEFVAKTVRRFYSRGKGT